MALAWVPQFPSLRWTMRYKCRIGNGRGSTSVFDSLVQGDDEEEYDWDPAAVGRSGNMPRFPRMSTPSTSFLFGTAHASSPNSKYDHDGGRSNIRAEPGPHTMWERLPINFVSQE